MPVSNWEVVNHDYLRTKNLVVNSIDEEVAHVIKTVVAKVLVWFSTVVIIEMLAVDVKVAKVVISVSVVAVSIVTVSMVT